MCLGKKGIRFIFELLLCRKEYQRRTKLSPHLSVFDRFPGSRLRRRSERVNQLAQTKAGENELSKLWIWLSGRHRRRGL